MSSSSTTSARRITPPEPSGARLEDSISFLINRAAMALGDIILTRLEPYRLSLGDWRVLRLLCEKGTCSSNELADTLGVDPSTMSRLVSSLVRRRFITRKRSSNDGRSVDLRLASRGNDVIRKLMSATVEERFLMGFSEEQLELLRDMLRQVRAKAEEFGSTSSHPLPVMGAAAGAVPQVRRRRSSRRS